MRAEEFVQYLDRARQSSPGKWSSRCPSHDDGNASLSISEGDDGRVLVQCFAGCSVAEIVDALDLKLKHLFPDMPAPLTLAELAHHKRLPVEFLQREGLHDIRAEGVGIPYVHEDGTRIVKLRKALVAKQGSRWPKDTPPMAYGRWRLQQIRSAGELILVEGETDALTGWFHGLPIIGIPGASMAAKTIDAAMLAGVERVCIVQDADRAGENFVGNVRAKLAALNFTGPVIAFTLPDAKDLSELHIKAGASFIEHFNRAIEAASRTPSEGAVELKADWPAPLPVEGGRAVPPRFDLALLPESFRPWLVDVSERIGSPAAFAPVAAIIALGAIIGRKVLIKPKRLDDWTVCANIWGVLVGPPGVRKTPALYAGIDPLMKLDEQSRIEFEARRADVQLKQMENKVKRAKLEAEMKRIVDQGGDPKVLLPQLAALDELPAGPRRRYTNDSTVEKLGELLAVNRNGMLVVRDELTGWLTQLDREGHEGERSFYLEGWSGTGSFSVDRISRGSLHFPNTVSLLGCIQPDLLNMHVRDAVRGGAGNDGLVQRLQLMVVSDEVPAPIDASPDAAARDRALEVFRRLDTATAADLGALTEGGRHYLPFSDHAQRISDAWRAELDQRTRASGIHPAFASHLAKYGKLQPSLALIFHLADVAAGLVSPGPVTEGAADLAIEWCSFLEGHARVIYSGITEGISATETLAQKIRSGEIKSGFTERDIQRRHWTGLKGDEVPEALEHLVELHWVRRSTVQTGGRPSVRYELNPALAGNSTS